MQKNAETNTRRPGWGFIQARGVRTVCLAALALLTRSAPVIYAAPASTLADLCPGTPDPCVVSGQFTVAPGSVFDAAGRAIAVLDGAELIGSGVAPFSVINAASIDLDPGSLVRTSPQRSPYYLHCPLNEGYTYAPRQPLSVFNGEDPNGAWTLRVTNQWGVYDGSLETWSLRICTENGCATTASTEVPLSLPFASVNESHLSIVATGSVTRVEVLGVTGIFLAYSGLHFDLVSPQGTLLRLLSQPCAGSAVSSTFSFSLADPIEVSDVTLQSTGPCTVGGEIALDDPAGGNGGALKVDCQTVTLEATAKTHANGGKGGKLEFDGSGRCSADGARLAANGGLGTPPGAATGGDIVFACDEVQVNTRTRLEANAPPVFPSYPTGGTIRLTCGAPGCSIAAGAMFTAKGSYASYGGAVLVDTTGPCRVGGKMDVSSKPDFYIDTDGTLGFFGGGGGLIEANCGSITVPPKTKLFASRSPYGDVGTIKLTAATTVQVEATASLRADGGDGYLRWTAFDIAAGDRCTVDGKVSGHSGRRNGPQVAFACEGFTVGRKGQVAISTGGAVGGTITVDTTGTASGEPPADCTIAGKVIARASSVDAANTGNAGTIRLRCGTTATVERTGTVDVSCSGFEGEAGFLDSISGGDTTVEGRMSGGGSFRGATMKVEACDVNVGSHGQVSAGGFGGPVTLTAHDALTIDGSVRGAPNGSVALNYRNAISVAGGVAPAPTVSQDTMLAPCP